MIRFKSKPVILIHLAVLVGVLGLAIFAGQNPRIILYGISISLLFRFTTVWFLSNAANSDDGPGDWVSLMSRPPLPGERSRPYYKHEKSREPAGLPNYLVGIFTIMFMIGILQLMATGSGFLKTSVLVPELAWGLFVAVIYWLEDIFSKTMIVAAGETTPKNLGYNVAGLNFLLAAIAITNIIFLVVMQIIVIAGFEKILRGGMPVEWMILSVLALIRFYYEIKLPTLYYDTGRRLPG